MKLYSLLANHHITYEKYEHPPLYTCDDANRLASHIPGAKTKNLFLRDRKGKRHFLVIVSDHKSVNLNELSVLLETSKLSFASAERLKQHLGIEPGAVSLLSLVNDFNHHVEVIIDEEIWSQQSIQCHPLVNTVTLVISKQGIEKFIEVTGHKLNLIKGTSNNLDNQ